MQFCFSYQDIFWWDDDDNDDVRFVLDQHTELDFYSLSSLKKQSMRVDISLHSIILIPSLCSYSLVLHALQQKNKYQFYSLWVDPTGDQTLVGDIIGNHCLN